MLINSARSFDELGLGELARALPPRAPADGAGDRACARAPRAPDPERGAARAGSPRSAAWSRIDSVAAADPGEVRRASSARATSPRPRAAFEFVRARDRGARAMLRQIEGSRAVAEAVALCRPEVICAYPISPQTHIVERALRHRAQPASWPRASSSTSSRSSRRCRSRSAPRPPARAPTRRPRARACSTWWRRSTTPRASGLPIVMTVANRAIGAPINIWNDHSDSMSQRDSGWIQLYAETNQEAVDLHIQAFRLAEELSLPVMVCMDGFILTHAYERLEVPDAGAGRRLPAAVRAAPGARPRRPGDDRRDGRPRGVLRGQVPRARQADAGARPDPRDRRRVRRAPSGATPAASSAATAARTPRRSSSRSAPCWARSRTRSTSCATRA